MAPTNIFLVSGRKPSQTLMTRAPKSFIVIIFKTREALIG
jgi:hypothetical protein